MFISNEDKVNELPLFTLAEVSEHCYSNDCWIVLFDRVYDVTNFLQDHPGGEFIICEYAGGDATIQFRNARHGIEAYEMMKKYCIGILIEVIVDFI
ncbi:cytochrome b5-like protein [Dinothrombium tinctorium]|uniref:Cytochrome b5-like protein n=1 Tax=Dinothrombium tinctorium TaxID=1965070 RepID=A0A3S3PMY3_9ACAR|nr:cytochrome b5-like protein [Dinothrombium tinctorium]